MNLLTTMREYASQNRWHHSWDVVLMWSDTELACAISGAKTRRGAIAKAWGVVRGIDQLRAAGNGEVTFRYGHKPVRPVSAFEFLAGLGGLRPTADIRYVVDGNPLISGKGPLLRASGMSPDRAREACVEAGYLQDTPWEGGVSVSTENDLYALLDDEARGSKRYPAGQEPVDFDYSEETTDECPF